MPPILLNPLCKTTSVLLRENYATTNLDIVKSKPFSQMTGRFLHLVYMVGHVCFHYSVVSNEYICLDHEELKKIVNILWLLKGELKHFSEYIDIYNKHMRLGFFMERIQHIGISYVFPKTDPPGLFSKYLIEGN